MTLKCDLDLESACSRDRYKIHFYCLAEEALFNRAVVECLPLDPTAQV